MASSTNFKPLFSSASDNWPTPQDFFDTLDTEFGFVLDVAASATNRKTDAYYGLDHPDASRRDGLAADWAADAALLGGAIWANVPYARGVIAKWMAKAAAAAAAGATVVCLVPSRTGTRWFHDHVLANDAEVRFVKGRLKFGDATNSAPFDSLVVVFRPPATAPVVQAEASRFDDDPAELGAAGVTAPTPGTPTADSRPVSEFVAPEVQAVERLRQQNARRPSWLGTAHSCRTDAAASGIRGQGDGCAQFGGWLNATDAAAHPPLLDGPAFSRPATVSMHWPIGPTRLGRRRGTWRSRSRRSGRSSGYRRRRSTRSARRAGCTTPSVSSCPSTCSF